MSLIRGPGRGRAFFRFLIAVAWWAATYLLSQRAAHGFVHGAAYPLLRNVFEIFLLIVGFGYMEVFWDGVRQPMSAMGLPARSGAAREFALGAALGWGMVTAVLLVIVLVGASYIRISTSAHAWESLVLQIFVLASASLAAEIAFRGYPFQKLIQSVGPLAAVVFAGIFFGLLRLETPGSTAAAAWISGIAAVVLAVAYLRTGALWLCWGLHFSWLASIGILFGQPLAGNRHASSVIHTYIDGPTWLTGSEYGPEASLITLAVLWIGLYFLFRITRDLAAKYAHPLWKPFSGPLETDPTATFTPPVFPQIPPQNPPSSRPEQAEFPQEKTPPAEGAGELPPAEVSAPLPATESSASGSDRG